MTRKMNLQLMVMFLFLLAATFAWAGGDASDGHTHADDPLPVPVQPDAPRAETATADFELVATIENGQLTLYVNDFASNAPLTKAQVELEFNGENHVTKESAPGIYRLAMPALSQPGQHTLTVSVTAGERADLLALTLGSGKTGDTASHSVGYQLVSLWPWLAGVLALVVAGIVAFAWRRRQAGGVMGLMAALIFVAGLPQADAHEGHDHGAEEPVVTLPVGSRPLRLPNGAVFMPKASQYQLNVRTQIVEPADWSRSLELAGHVQADPSASAQVQAGQAGRIEPGPRGLPHVGMKVRRGEVLAWLVPVASSLERGGVAVASTELATSLALAERRLKRLKELEGSVPAKEIEAATLEVDGLRQRKIALSGSLGRREALTAPVSGEIADVKVSIGQVLDVRDMAFSIINREHLIIEALAYHPQLSGVQEASAATLDGTPVAVSFLGVGAQLKEHALPVQFRVKDARGLVVGQPVKVFVKLKDTTSGIKLTRSALARGAAGEPAVWLKNSAEMFVLRPVATEPLDGGHVIVRDLQKGARVVTQGASLLNQVR